MGLAASGSRSALRTAGTSTGAEDRRAFNHRKMFKLKTRAIIHSLYMRMYKTYDGKAAPPPNDCNA